MSLRDVERAMIVFEYFFEKMESVFAPLTDQKALEDYNERYAVGQVKVCQLLPVVYTVEPLITDSLNSGPLCHSGQHAWSQLVLLSN